jgi:hypothetical protein
MKNDLCKTSVYPNPLSLEVESETLKHLLLNKFANNTMIDLQVSITAYSLDWLNFEVKDCTKANYTICKGFMYTSRGIKVEPHAFPKSLADVTVFSLSQLHKINCFVEDYIRKLHKERRCLT